MSSLSELTTCALALRTEERVQLAQELWESLHRSISSGTSVEVEALNESDLRDQALEQSVVTALTHEGVMAEARNALQCK